jgi:hypothetical protein
MPKPPVGTLLLALAVLGCQADRVTWSGPLGAVTDSVAREARLVCQRDQLVGQFGERRFAEPPLRYCEGTKGDTAIFIVVGKRNRVVSVGRIWQAPGRQGAAHAALIQAISAQRGPGTMCPQSDDLAVQSNVRWEGPGYNLGVARIDSAGVGWNYLLGPIDCHRL